MASTGFWWILLSIIIYGVLHSILAANRVKAWVCAQVGPRVFNRFYRLFFAVMGGVTFLPSLALVALLPDRTIYTIPAPWVYLTIFLQVASLLGLAAGVSQTGALAFIGIRQLMETNSECGPRPEKLVVTGLYRLVRHPLYLFSLLFIWLVPTLTWNLLALNLGVTAYLWVGSIFEERKLAEQFGQAYLDYHARTPRIIPGQKV